MNTTNFKSISDVFLYIEKHNIQTVEIRFLDNKLLLRSFSLNPKLLSSKIFTSKYFKFNNFFLLGVSIKRAFKDPFLSHPTLVFFTNTVEHFKKLMLLKQQTVSSPYLVDFYIKGDIKYNTYEYSPPPFDNNREIRDEIALAASCMEIKISSSFCKENNCIVLALQSINNLHLLDNIEKLKYAILMVASVYNQKVDITRGIFVKASLLE